MSNKKISEAHAKEILSLKNEKDQLNLFKKILQHGLSVKATYDINNDFKRSQGKKISEHDYKDREKEDFLRKFFNSQVKIRRKKSGGEVIISFSDDDVLRDVVAKLK